MFDKVLTTAGIVHHIDNKNSTLNIENNVNNNIGISINSSDSEEESFFEGAEKLLEVWFKRSSLIDEGDADEEAKDCRDNASLRRIPYSELEAMLDLAQCHILHCRTNGVMDSYLLSESSMFVTDNRLILKTCGTTQLLETVPRFLELAERYSHGVTTVANVYYSRKNFLRPELQPVLHETFGVEVDTLNKYFCEGQAYCMGSLLSDDRWFLYTNDFPEPPVGPDQTLEIQMSQMPWDVLRMFSREVCANGEECTRRANIDKLFPIGTLVHEELFDPVGYSMNGLIPNTNQYVTIHVTPEPAFSYVSYETNHSQECLVDICQRVIDCFRPSKFIVTLFANELSERGQDAQRRFFNGSRSATLLQDYRRTNLQFLYSEFDTLMFATYERTNGNQERMGINREQQPISSR